jgi:hypothetical protein
MTITLPTSFKIIKTVASISQGLSQTYEVHLLTTDPVSEEVIASFHYIKKNVYGDQMGMGVYAIARFDRLCEKLEERSYLTIYHHYFYCD